VSGRQGHHVARELQGMPPLKPPILGKCFVIALFRCGQCGAVLTNLRGCETLMTFAVLTFSACYPFERLVNPPRTLLTTSDDFLP
jgi:hypothetical protein